VSEGGSNAVFVVGSHGCLRCKDDRTEFVEGLDYVIKVLKPKTIIVYGAAPDSVFKKYRDCGIQILCFESDFSKSRKRIHT